MELSKKKVYIETTIPSLISWNLTHLGDVAFNKVVEYNVIRNLWVPGLLDPDTFMRKMKREEENG